MIPKKEDQTADDARGEAVSSSQVQSSNPTKRATLNLTVDEAFKWEVKEWAARHRLSVVDTMKEGFKLMQAKHGK